MSTAAKALVSKVKARTLTERCRSMHVVGGGLPVAVIRKISICILYFINRKVIKLKSASDTTDSLFNFFDSISDIKNAQVKLLSKKHIGKIGVIPG
jgi:hypothetical protein